MGTYHQYTFNNIERESRMQIIFPSQKFMNYNNQSLKSSATSTVFMLVGVRQPAWTYAGFSTLNSTKQLNSISRMWQSFSLVTHWQLP